MIYFPFLYPTLLHHSFISFSSFITNQQYPKMHDSLLLVNQSAEKQQRNDLTKENQYANNFQHLCAVIGFAVGYGSFWRFPYMVYEYGSQFVLIYFIILLLFGLPILYLQTALGQIHQQSMPFIFARINKGLKFLGLTFVLICYHFSGYYNIILAYSYRYVFSVFDPTINFEEESIRDNKIFAETILHSSQRINQFQGINWGLFVFYVVSVLGCYFIIAKGVKAAGKVIVFTSLFPYALFIIMFTRGITLPGALSGLNLLFTLKGNLFNPTIWFQATIQVFYQLTLACSGIVHLSSMKTKSQPFVNGLYVILFSVFTCGVLCAMNIFIYLGHFAEKIGVAIQDITLEGPEICFNIFPKALAILPFPRVWLFLFFVTMVLLGIDTMIGGMQAVICYLKDQAKSKLRIFGKKIKFQHMKIALCLSYILFIFPLTSHAGIHYLLWFDRFCVYIPLAVNIIVQIYVFVYVFKFEELEREVRSYTGESVPKYVAFFLRSKVLIAILGINLVLTLFNQFFVFYVEYTAGFYFVGWLLTLYPYILAWVYWQNNKQDKFRITFKQIQLTYNTYQYDERTSYDHSQDTEMCEITRRVDFGSKLQNKSNSTKQGKSSKETLEQSKFSTKTFHPFPTRNFFPMMDFIAI